MKRFRGCLFPGGEFRPLSYAQNCETSGRFAAGLPVTRIDERAAEAELQFGDLSVRTVVVSAGSDFSPEQTVVPVSLTPAFEPLALPATETS